jgi:cytochrome bd-type quinol oxidase subunit 2
MTTPTTDAQHTNGVAPLRIHHPSTLNIPTTDIATAEPSTHDTPQPTTASETTPEKSHKTHKPWPLLIIGLAAAVAVWSGWVGLGQLAGFGVIHPLPGIWDDLQINTAVVLPLSVEAYAAYALRVWLATETANERTQRFAKRSAIASMIIGAVAQVAYHLMSAAGYTHAPWPVVTLVATVPVVVLGLASALAKLVTASHQEAQR